LPRINNRDHEGRSLKDVFQVLLRETEKQREEKGKIKKTGETTERRGKRKDMRLEGKGRLEDHSLISRCCMKVRAKGPIAKAGGPAEKETGGRGNHSEIRRNVTAGEQDEPRSPLKITCTNTRY